MAVLPVAEPRPDPENPHNLPANVRQILRRAGFPESQYVTHRNTYDQNPAHRGFNQNVLVENVFLRSQQSDQEGTPVTSQSIHDNIVRSVVNPAPWREFVNGLRHSNGEHMSNELKIAFLNAYQAEAAYRVRVRLIGAGVRVDGMDSHLRQGETADQVAAQLLPRNAPARKPNEPFL